MDSRVCQPRALDLHQLQAPFRHTRVQRPAQIRRLMQSIDADGQRVPLAVVTGSEQFILVDGYSRWEALQRLGRDTAVVEVWSEPLAGALIQVLARHQGRSFEPIEQAWMLSAAVAEGASQHDLAHALGKDPSWVNRRLALLTQLGEPLQEAVRGGVLSSWAASRILVPLARACPHRRRDPPGLPATRAAVDARTQRLVSALSPGQSHGTRTTAGPTAAVHPSQRKR